jgi:signal transduction histidine kinase
MRARSQAERESQYQENLDRLSSLRLLLGSTVTSVFVVTLVAAFLIARYETRLLADLAKQTRLAELAQFSSGMAHQIKNPLAAMRGYAELIARQLDDPLQKKMSDKLIAEIAALDRVVRDFLAFSRGAHGSPEKVNLRTALSPIVEAARSRGAGTVTVNLDMAEAAANTELDIDATALRQALLNLGTNAAEALREIESENKKLDIRAHVAGKLVTVEFEDNGPGIAEEVKGKLFEPFVTGKADGTGLGLAISRRLLRDMGGDLLLVRTGPTGTMFRASFAKKGEA